MKIQGKCLFFISVVVNFLKGGRSDAGISDSANGYTHKLPQQQIAVREEHKENEQFQVPKGYGSGQGTG